MMIQVAVEHLLHPRFIGAGTAAQGHQRSRLTLKEKDSHSCLVPKIKIPLLAKPAFFRVAHNLRSPDQKIWQGSTDFLQIMLRKGHAQLTCCGGWVSGEYSLSFLNHSVEDAVVLIM